MDGGQHDGLLRLDDQVQEIARFLDRVGAVRDDNAIHVRHRGELVDAAGQLQPDFIVHVLRADVRDLFAAQHGELLRLGHGGEELIDAYLAGGVAGLHIAGRRAGDGAASGEDDDVRELCGHERGDG